MKEVTLVGLDIGERVFQFYGVDLNGNVVVPRKLH
jgi:hypothetical protein